MCPPFNAIHEGFVLQQHAIFSGSWQYQTLLESLMRELANLGVEVEPERWWDKNQTGDILHYMNRPGGLNVILAHQKGFKVVMTENLDKTASRSRIELFGQRFNWDWREPPCPLV